MTVPIIMASATASGGRLPSDDSPPPRAAVLALCWLLLLSHSACAEDTVIIATGKDNQLRTQKRGTILDYTGTQLRLQGQLGREEQIPTDRVLEIRTEWTAPHRAADELRSQGKLSEAISAYRQAKREETRPWAVRRIMASLVGTYFESGQVASAGDEFLGLVASDPTTQYYDSIPLCWRSTTLDGALEARAATWLAAERFPAAVLLGASWQLAGARRGEAIAALQKLALDQDQRLAALAEMQLWRTRLVTAAADDAQKWQSLVEKLPTDIRAGGYYLVGEVFARHNQPEQAALAYLHVPLVHSGQRVLAAEALLAAGKQLETLSRASQAAGLYREIAADYSTASAAAEARSRLEALTATPAEPAAEKSRSN